MRLRYDSSGEWLWAAKHDPDAMKDSRCARPPSLQYSVARGSTDCTRYAMSHMPAALDSAHAQHRFFVGVSGLFLAIALVGFAPSFFLKVVFEHPGAIVEQAELLRRNAGEDGPGVPRLPLYVVAHGALSTAWFVLFFAQTMLISSERRAVHQTLGVGVVVSGVSAIVLAIPRLVTLGNPPDPSVVIAEQLPGFSGDLRSFVAFAVAVGGAAYFRRRPETHKYLMLLASMILVPVPNARIWGWSGVENALEFWLPLTENGLLVLIIGSDWLIRRRTPWVLLGGFAFVGVLYGAMVGLGSTHTAQSWALGWMS